MSENGSGRYSYTVENGETWYFAADGIPIKKEYYEQRETEYTAVNAQKETVKNARAAFQQQLDSDGWAGKTADAVSVLWNSDNRAVKVDEDLKIYENQVKELQQAQSKGAAKFSAKFKEIYGVDYNPANIAAYEANPTDENYKKAYGTKNDIHKRVMDYNASQQQGAAVVKITVEVGGAIALGAATIATGGIAGGIAVAAGATFVADVAVETTDRMSSANGLQDGELGQIAQNAVTDAVIAGTTLGAGKALGAGYKMYKGMKVVTAATGTTASTAARAVNKAVLSKTEGAVLDAVADTAVGAGAEYVETGHITAEGTLTNMAIGAGGLVIGKFGNKLRNVDNKFPTSADAPASQAAKTHLMKQQAVELIHQADDWDKKSYNNLLHDIQGELPNATPQRGAQLHYEADLHQNQSRAQGREIKHVVESEYNVTTRNKKHTGDSTQRSEQFVEEINKQAEQSAEHILSGNQGVLAPHDAAILDEHLVNNLNTIEDIEGFITKLKNRVGVDNNGKMFVQQVQGVDHAAKVLENAETKLTKLRNQLTDFKAAGSAADSAVGAARGLNEQELAAISSYVDKAVSYDDLQALVDKFAQNKCLRNSSAARNLYKKMQDKALNLQLKQQSVAANAQSATRTNEPAPIAGETSNNVSGNDADFAAVQQQMIREGKLNPDGTPISGEQIKIASKQALTPSENKAIKFDEIRMSNRTPNGKANPGKTMGELLTPQQKKVYSDSMNAFERSKNRKITHNASNVLTIDNLLHGTNINILLSNGGILDNGLIPREITGNCSAHFTNGVVPDTLTPLCSDVWDIRQNATIKDYFDANNSHWNNNGESRFLPNSDTKAVSVVVVLDKNSIDPTLIDNSFEVNDSGRSVLFENGNMTRGHNYPTHRTIPIGAPANSIDRIIVDTRSLGQTQINELHKKIESLGLDIKLYDLNGKSI